MKQAEKLRAAASFKEAETAKRRDKYLNIEKAKDREKWKRAENFVKAQGPTKIQKSRPTKKRNAKGRYMSGAQTKEATKRNLMESMSELEQKLAMPSEAPVRRNKRSGTTGPFGTSYAGDRHSDGPPSKRHESSNSSV